MRTLLFALWFFLPGGLANGAPVFASRIPRLKKWNTPMDLDRKFRGKRLFGPNKTWRGLLSGVIVGSLTGVIIYTLYPESARRLEMTSSWPLAEMMIFGALLGIGALLGDAAESFFKRQLDIKSGHSWFPFDQIDFIFGGLLASTAIVRLPLFTYGVILAVWFALHIIGTYVGYRIGLRDRSI